MAVFAAAVKALFENVSILLVEVYTVFGLDNIFFPKLQTAVEMSVKIAMSTKRHKYGDMGCR